MKRCSKCGEEKPLSLFGSNGQGRKKSSCRPCFSAYMVGYEKRRLANKTYAAMRAIRKRLHRQRNAGAIRAQRNRYRRMLAPEVKAARNRLRSQRRIATCSRSYIRRLIREYWPAGLPIPNDFVEVKRNHLLLLRDLKGVKP